MTDRIVYCRGEFVPEDRAVVPLMDRGLLFAAAVYEGLGILGGKIIDFPHHHARLVRSLGELGIAEPFTAAELWAVLTELIERNRADEGFLYLHVTRGVAERDYVYAEGLEPTVFAFVQAGHYGSAADAQPPVVSLATHDDWRWARRDIKTPNLLAQVIAKQAAHAAGADEALLLRGDEVIEAGSASFFFVADGTIVTRPLSRDILPGVTRRSVLAVAAESGFEVDERTATLDEVLGAQEAFITASSSYVEAVGSIDGHPFVAPGPITTRLREIYLDHARASAVVPPFD